MTIRVILCAAIVGVFASTATAQHIASEQSRREALSHYRNGQELMSGERFERAIEEFDKAIKSDELMTLAYFGRGQAFMNLRRYASAVVAYRACLEAYHSLYTIEQTNHAAVDRQRNDLITELNDIIRRMAENPATKEGNKIVQFENQLHEIQQQKEAGDGGFRPPAEVLLGLGSALFRSGDAAGAEAEWKAAVDSNPKLGEAHNNLAVIYMQTGRLDDAARELTAAKKAGFRVNPQFEADLKQRRN